MIKKFSTPIYDRVRQYHERQTARFHVPGHKGGHFSHEKTEEFLQSALALDFTELTGLDDLHHPEGIIKEAQQKAATCFFAEETYFLVGGSTAGNLAMILGSIKRGELVLVQRNSHKSIFQGLALAEAEAIFLDPEFCSTFSVPSGISLENVAQALKQYPASKAIILTYPNYYGMAQDIGEIIQLARQKGLLVLVDEAHGAHFGQHPLLPASAIRLGADVSVQSTHKMLSSMTMTSMLHMKGNRVPKEDIELFLQSIQSSSPSYPLMASLDLARDQLENLQDEDWCLAIEEYAHLRREIKSLGYKVSPIEDHSAINALNLKWDPFKLILQPTWELTGIEFQQLLENENIYIELADPYNVLLTLPITPHKDWNVKLIRALREIAQSNSGTSTQKITSHQNKQLLARNYLYSKQTNPQSFVPIPMRIIRASEKCEVELQAAVYKKAAEMVIPYPPGIPLLVPGEMITQEVVEVIQNLQKVGVYFQGKNKGFITIQVVE